LFIHKKEKRKLKLSILLPQSSIIIHQQQQLKLIINNKINEREKRESKIKIKN